MRPNAAPSRLPTALAVLMALGLATGLTTVNAQPAPSVESAGASGTEPDWALGMQGISVRAGYLNHYRNLSLVYETPAWWSHTFERGWGRLDLTGELGVTYWDSTREQPDSMWQASITPMFRWWLTEHFYAEAGIGATVMSRTEFAGRHLSTAFQFGDHVGFGTVVNRNHRIGVRYSHYSNGGIKTPNQGVNIVELTYTYQF